MTYSEAGFQIVLTNNVVEFSGKLEKSNYEKVDVFLRNIDQTVSAPTCILDLTQLSFLNSSGIRSLATFMLGSPKQFELRINPEITWQKESIPTLTYLKPNAIRIAA